VQLISYRVIAIASQNAWCKGVTAIRSIWLSRIAPSRGGRMWGKKRC